MLKLNINLAEIQSDRGTHNLILAKDLVGSACERYKLENPKVLGLILSVLNLKIYSYNIRSLQIVIPRILGEHVIATSGTGVVHTAPGHGVDDL